MVLVGVGSFAALAAVVVLGAAVQGTLGFGMNLLVAPIASILVPEAVPAALIMCAAPLTVAIVAREWSHVSWSPFRWTVVGRLPGTLLGVWLVGHFAGRSIGVATGTIVIVGTLLSIPTGGIAVTPFTSLVAGWASSAMGTAAGVGGPPMALLFQNEDPKLTRATISASFTIGTAISLVGLSMGGEISGDQMITAAALWPFVALGFAASRLTIGRVDHTTARRWVLFVAGCSGVAALVRALM